MRRASINPASGYPAATQLRQEIAQCGEAMLTAIGADKARIVWTSGATEANNLAIAGLLAGLGDHAVCAAPGTEHASVLAPLEAHAPELRTIPVTSDGNIDYASLPQVIDRKVRLVSITASNNETGVTHDLVRLRRCLDQLAPRARLHVDAAQAFGKLPIPWEAARIDMLAATGHKLNGPGGVGCLLLRDNVHLSPLIHGGGQQANLRSGTLDASGILAFCQAVQLALRNREDHYRHATVLADCLWRKLASANLPEWLRLSPTALDQHSPYVCSFSIPGYQGAVLVRMLGERGIMVSSGSACAAETGKPSHVLSAMGHLPEIAFGALRVSFSATNRTADVNAFVDALEEILKNW
jgi:cysteine desulfurase